MTVKKTLSAVWVVVVLGLAVAVLACEGEIVHRLLTTTNHWGVQMSNIVTLALVAMSTAIVGLKYGSASSRRLAGVLLVLGAGLLVTILACDRFNLLVEYGVWLDRGMPARGVIQGVWG